MNRIRENVFIRAAMMLAVAIAGCARMHSSSTLMPPGTVVPPLNADGWINGPGPDADDLSGKVVVLDAWAYW
jgi:hypothetical protein